MKGRTKEMRIPRGILGDKTKAAKWLSERCRGVGPIVRRIEKLNLDEKEMETAIRNTLRLAYLRWQNIQPGSLRTIKSWHHVETIEHGELPRGSLVVVTPTSHHVDTMGTSFLGIHLPASEREGVSPMAIGHPLAETEFLESHCLGSTHEGHFRPLGGIMASRIPFTSALEIRWVRLIPKKK